MIVLLLLLRFLLLRLIFLVLLLIFLCLVFLLLRLLFLLFLFFLLLLLLFKLADQCTCQFDVGSRIRVVGIPAQSSAVVRDSITQMFDGCGLVLFRHLYGLRIQAIAKVVTTV